MAYKCVVWGIGNDYEIVINQLQFEVCKGNVEVVALVARQQDVIGKKLDGYSIILKEELKDIQFDYVVITSSLYYQEIRRQAIELGIDGNIIINGAVMNLPLFDFSRYTSLLKNRITILSDDCWGGYVYHRLFLQFYLPLINIYWQKDAFVKFIQKPVYYLNKPLEMEREGNIRGGICPVGSLGEGNERVCMEFVHSFCFEDAKRLWDKRRERMNFNNMFIKLELDASMEGNENLLRAFSGVKQKKICFYSGETEVEDVLYLKRFEKFVRSGSRVDTIKYHDYIRNLNWLLKSVDILKLLNGEKDFLRED